MIAWLDQLEFIRPGFLLSLMPLLWLAWRVHNVSDSGGSDWQKIMEPELFRALSGTQLAANQATSITRRLSVVASVVVAFLLSLALAGPSWETRETPVVERVTSRIMVMDLSLSMLAEDIKPNRLSRAKIKLREMLSRSSDGQTGLIVFAGDAYAIAPLTEDVRTLDNLVPPLNVDLMPSQGSRIDLGLKLAGEMLIQTQAIRAQVILLTDSPATPRAMEMADELASRGHRVDVLGFGSAKGAPIPSGETGFVQKDGAIVFAKLERKSLRQLAKSGNGRFLQASSGNGDIAQLLAVDGQQEFKQSEQAASSAQRVDGGVFFLLAALPLILLGMRGRGLLLVLLLCSAGLMTPRPGFAAEASWWESLWKNNDQRAHQQLLDGDAAAAVGSFDDPDWRASADYQAGNFQDAAAYWMNKDNATASYNRGNSLAKSGELEGALEAYQQAVDVQPDFEDAEANASLIEKLLKEQQPEGQEGEQGEEAQEGEEGQESKDGEKGEQGQESQEGEEGQHQQGEPGEERQEGQGNQQGQEGQDGEPSESSDEQAGDQVAEQISQQERQQMQKAGEQSDEQQESMDQAAQQLSEQTEESGENAEDSEQAITEGQESEETGEEQAERQVLRRPNLQDQATDQWLNRIEDNPAGLLRRKFAYEADRRAAEQSGASVESGDLW
ncbi:MAG: Ca-activated chloride channel family protein [Gammaproteobacteria bacterium]|jgi:Ca-activated chloride channel family protein